jgi:hypothetical protein
MPWSLPRRLLGKYVLATSLDKKTQRHGAQTARSLAKRILGRWLSREELRFLCWIEKDDESYVHAIETHRLAWDQTG